MIIEHPTLRYDGPPPYYFPEAAMVVQCDFCRKMSERVGNNIEEAVEEARKVGFTTTKDPKDPYGPRKWTCGCTKKD